MNDSEKQRQRENLDEEIKDYKASLVERYWAYQRQRFPDWEGVFEKPFAGYRRPPVFPIRQAWRNVIINPRSSEQEKTALLDFIPNGEHHKWFRSMNSSQALALSILGNLAVHNCMDCLIDLKDDDGNDLWGSAQLCSNNFSMEHKIKHLREKRHTSLDGYFCGNYRVAIECKFTEAEVGTCSRPQLTPADSNFQKEYCDGSYTQQKKRTDRCSLTEIGVGYWEYIPALFHFGNVTDLNPCPVSKNYQLIRNILAIGVNEAGAVSDEKGHVVLIYDERNPAFRAGGKGFVSYTETRAALNRPNMLRKCSWQKITGCIRQKKTLSWLTDELDMKYGL